MEVSIGRITHYYDRIHVAVLNLSDELMVGDRVRIRGNATDFIQEVVSMEIEHQKVTSVGPDDEVALKVNEPARKGDTLYKIFE